jgi:glutathione synthase/RimK-type ligase-like ATP-grasp enzyme
VTICVLGDTEDLSAVYLAWAARNAGHEVLELDEGRMGVAWAFGLDDAAPEGGWLDAGGRVVPLAEIGGAFVRFAPDAEVGFGLPDDEAEVARWERRAAIHRLVDAFRCPVVNRTRGGRANGSKPLQMLQLAAAGFAVPPWLATNDARAAARFAAQDDCIYKSVSGLRSRVRAVDDALLDRLRAGSSPVIVQRRVEGRDVRIHTVGADHAFATEVASEGVDYRFDGSRSYRAVEAPAAIADLCLRTAAAEGLVLGGFDFRVGEDGRWWCLELNPMPSYIPYQWATGQPIAEAVLELFGTRYLPAR